MNIPEPNIDVKDLKRLKKVGDIEYSKLCFFRKGVWIVCIEKKKNYKKYQSFGDYEHAVIFAEIIKLGEKLGK